MKKKRLGIDIDGTVTCPTTFVPFINESFNKNITLDDIKEYNLIPLIGISEKEFWQWMDQNESRIYSESPLATFAKKTISGWHNQHELIYISARRNHLLDITYDWFSKHNIPFNHIELVGKHDKIEKVNEHNIDIFFEDNYDNACSISEGCNIPVLLFDTPYNRKTLPKNVHRVENWVEADEWVSNWIKNIENK